MLTFNPGWDQNAEKLESFTNVRDLQKNLELKGIELTSKADESGSGPTSFTLTDPDGTTILIDQHV